MKPKKRPQEIAAQDLAWARKGIVAATAKIKRATTSLRMWEARAARYAKLASMTDAEVEAAKITRLTKQAARQQGRARRAITTGAM